MQTVSVLVAAVALLGLTAPTFAQSSPLPPLGIAMEEYPYPYPVKFLPLVVEGESVRMAYMDVAPASNANGRTIVLLHGKNFYGAYWQDTIKVLTGAGYRVVVPDQLGFGKSSKPDVAYSFDLLAANTAKLLDTLSIQKAVIVGHSMGGMLATRFARTYPDRTEQLVLENPIGLEDYRLATTPQSLEELTDAELRQTPEAYQAYVASYFVTYPKEKYQPIVDVRTRTTESGEFPRWARASARTYQMIYQQPVCYEFNQITEPTLLIIGQADHTVVGKNRVPLEKRDQFGQYPELGRRTAKAIQNSQLVEIPNVGHIPHLEAPAQFYAALLNFLKTKP